MKSNKFAVYNDIFLNIFASILLTTATQIIALPLMSREINIHLYGQILTMFALMNLLAVPFGGTLSDSRLLLKIKTLDNDIDSAFNFIVFCLLIVNFFILICTYTIFFEDKFYHYILMSLASCFLLLRAYYIVEFRITLNYKKILKVSIFSLVGYFIGILIFYILNIWSIVFFIGEMLPTIYILITSKIIKFKWKRHPIIKTALSSFSFLVVSSFINFIIMYSDRFFLNPILGSKYVSIFLVSSFLGKTIGIILAPISSVLFSYYVKETKITIPTFYKRIVLFFIITSFSFLIILFFGKPLLNVLYPTIFPYIEEYYLITNLGAVLYIYGNLLQPTLLSTAGARTNTIVQVLYFLIYILFGYLFIVNYGFLGFCMSVVISNVLRIFLIILITTIVIKKNIIRLN